MDVMLLICLSPAVVLPLFSDSYISLSLFTIILFAYLYTL